MTEYLTNYMCFVVLSVEIFTILFVYGIVDNIIAVLFADTVVLLGLLLIGLMKRKFGKNWLALSEADGTRSIWEKGLDCMKEVERGLRHVAVFKKIRELV